MYEMRSILSSLWACLPLHMYTVTNDDGDYKLHCDNAVNTIPSFTAKEDCSVKF